MGRKKGIKTAEQTEVIRIQCSIKHIVSELKDIASSKYSGKKVNIERLIDLIDQFSS